MAFMKAGLKLLVLCAGLAIAGSALADGKLTEKNMSKKDFRDITTTESSVPGEEPTTPPVHVHNLDKDAEKELRDSNGVRIIKGKDWKAMTPEERDARLRQLKELRPAGSLFILEVPSGNVWVIDGDVADDLFEDGVIRDWTFTQLFDLPQVRPTAGDIGYRDRHQGFDRERDQVD
ncbi:MAG: hypothetical protein JNL25_01705 [Rhodospirillaceae bacterium]|nr:hypothetical protein [Rhodospirillaceae bacterium]